MNQSIGYGWRKKSEDVEDALKSYELRKGFDSHNETIGLLNVSKEEAEQDYKTCLEEGDVSKEEEIVYFKVTIQDC